MGTANWTGSMWEQEAAEEGFAEGAEQLLLGEDHSGMRGDVKWQERLVQTREVGIYGECSMCTQTVGQMALAHQQPLQNMPGWWVAQTRTRWRSRQKRQQELVGSLRR